MLDIVATSRLGLIDRHRSVVAAENTATEGGLALRTVFAARRGRLLGGPAWHTDQLAAAAEAMLLPSPDAAGIVKLATTLASALARVPQPLAIEVLSYQTGDGPELFAVAHQLAVSGDGVRLTERQGDACTQSWLCATRHTNSRGLVAAQTRVLHRDGYAAAVTVSQGAIIDVSPGTLVVRRTGGDVVIVSGRCDLCEDLYTVDLLAEAGLAGPGVVGLGVYVRAMSLAEMGTDVDGAWLVDIASGVTVVDEICGRRVASPRDNPFERLTAGTA